MVGEPLFLWIFDAADYVATGDGSTQFLSVNVIGLFAGSIV